LLPEHGLIWLFTCLSPLTGFASNYYFAVVELKIALNYFSLKTDHNDEREISRDLERKDRPPHNT
jgi:hypothetical protein